MAFQEYQSIDDLRQVQKLSILLLEEFDRACKELNLSYSVYAGTAIGAIRHGGFIPWDDDVDVCMPRKEYEYFLSHADEVLSDSYELTNVRNTPNFPCTFSYLALKDTVFIPEFYKGCDYKRPLSIDVFPLDNVPDDDKSYKRQAKRTWLWGRLAFLRATPTPYLAFDGMKRTVVLGLCRIAHELLKLVGITPAFIQKKWEKAARMYENEATQYMADYSDRDPKRWMVSRDEFFPTSEIPFDGIKVQLVHDYDAVLTRGYGDYMEMPPLSERKNHRPYVLDFGPYSSY